MSEKRHILFIASDLSIPGGLERIVVQTANLVSKNHKTTILICSECENIFYAINSSIKIVTSPLNFGITSKGNIISRKINLLKEISKLRNILNNIAPDLIICSEYPFSIASVIAKKGNVRIYSWEHNHFSAHKKNLFWKMMMRRYYPKLDGIICINSDEQELYSPFNKTTILIPNFIKINPEKVASPKQQILTVGRLTEAKGIINLLEVASKILIKYPDWKWLIVGAGELEDLILDYINVNNLIGKLILQTPVSDNINREYQSSSIYVMTSKHESFGMVLVEAMSHGLPCIAFDCETGPRHIIAHEVDGILIMPGDIDKMAESISLLIEDNGLRKRMGENAMKNVQRFNAEKIYPLWEKIINMK